MTHTDQPMTPVEIEKVVETLGYVLPIQNLQRYTIDLQRQLDEARAEAERVGGLAEEWAGRLRAQEVQTERLRAALDGWQPIETAPRDGTEVTLVLANLGRTFKCTDCKWTGTHWVDCDGKAVAIKIIGWTG